MTDPIMSRLGPLFRPYQLKTLRLPNRVVMAPMTRSFSPSGVPTPAVAAYYRRRAEGGVGLIVTEGTGVDRPSALNEPDIPHFHGEAALAGWRRVVEEVHAAGGRIAPQIWHVGGKASRSAPDWRPPAPYESPSGLSPESKPEGKAMSDADVADTIDAFARAAGEAERLGFDAVEVHAAHGYLIDQFFVDVLNRRTDGYGGATLVERARFAADILRAIRAAVRTDFPVIVRLSLSKPKDFGARLAATPAEFEAWLGALATAGADAFHLSQPEYWRAAFPEADARLNLAGWAKKLTGLTAVTVGSVGLSPDVYKSFRGESAKPTPLDDLLARLEREEFDLVAVGRALLQDPDWLGKVRDGRLGARLEFTPAEFAALS